ncbi:MAG: hypothetical protein M3P53_00695 [Actinomycetota bacterium]|nr:hypothetical protein [Actinomycetota bacterium]
MTRRRGAKVGVGRGVTVEASTPAAILGSHSLTLRHWLLPLPSTAALLVPYGRRANLRRWRRPPASPRLILP